MTKEPAVPPGEATAVPVVVVITHCPNFLRLWNQLLVFKTIRTGFPTAQIRVIDNGSVPDAVGPIKEAAESAGAIFTQMLRRYSHAELLETVLRARAAGALVFCDPDVSFWQPVEHWTFGDALLAGRLLPQFSDDVTGCVVAPRLHTSLLFLPDVAEVLEEVSRLAARFPHFQPFHVSMSPAGETGMRAFDTFGGIYWALKDRTAAFTPEQLDCYDHLFGASGLLIFPGLPKAQWGAYLETHRRAEIDHTSMKGIWRQQEAYFNSQATDRRIATPLIDPHGLPEAAA